MVEFNEPQSLKQYVEFNRLKRIEAGKTRDKYEKRCTN